jgi:hypothetical protein
MNKIIVLFLMIFMHIVDDYYLQGILAKMKQKSWWKENAPQIMYEHDYLAALYAHGFSWAFLVTLPLVIACYEHIKPITYAGVLLINMHAHAVIDHSKCNRHEINLIQDQLIHLAQILVLYGLFYGMIGGGN